MYRKRLDLHVQGWQCANKREHRGLLTVCDVLCVIVIINTLLILKLNFTRQTLSAPLRLLMLSVSVAILTYALLGSLHTKPLQFSGEEME